MRAANYVEETTTSIAGTSGDGAVTLTAITNVPRFSTVFGTQNTTVRYVIEDTVNKKFESGIGAVSSNVLTRTRPQITWDGTTWSATTAATPLQFGSSPTSGNIKVRMAALAQTQAPNLPSRNTSVSGDATWRDYPVSAHTSWTSTGSGYALTANREHYFAYQLTQAGLLQGIQWEVTTGVAGGAKLALYACGADGLPGAKIVDFVTTTTNAAAVKADTATGSWSPAGAVWLEPGWYYIGLISDVAPSIRVTSGPVAHRQTPLMKKDAYGYGSLVYVAGNYTTGLPASPSLSGGTLVSCAFVSFGWFGLKVAS